VEVDVVPLEVFGILFGSSYMYMRDFIFMKRGEKSNIATLPRMENPSSSMHTNLNRIYL